MRRGGRWRQWGPAASGGPQSARTHAGLGASVAAAAEARGAPAPPPAPLPGTRPHAGRTRVEVDARQYLRRLAPVLLALVQLRKVLADDGYGLVEADHPGLHLFERAAGGGWARGVGGGGGDACVWPAAMGELRGAPGLVRATGSEACQRAGGAH
jgi:hypothetical protein